MPYYDRRLSVYIKSESSTRVSKLVVITRLFPAVAICLASGDKSLELDPNNAPAYDSRGCLYTEMKEHKKALSDFNKAIELDPNLEEAYRNRAKVYEALGEKEKAKADIEKADSLSKERGE